MLKGIAIALGFVIMGAGYELAVTGSAPGAVLAVGLTGFVILVGALVGD